MSVVHELFPQTELRANQEELCELVYKNYHKYDVFLINAPVAFGKTPLAKFIMNVANRFGHSANYIHPDNVLVNQAARKFPDLATLSLKRNYAGGDYFKKAKEKVTAARQSTMNYHTLLANRIYKHTLVIDEAHNVFDMLQDMAGKHMWEDDPEFIDEAYNTTNLLLHLGTMKTAKAKTWKKALTKHPDKYTTYYDNGVFRGQEKRMLKLAPLTVKDHPPVLWPPHRTKKIFLMSATISMKDVEDLGLGNRRVLYLEADSDIPQERRPFIYEPIMRVNHRNLKEYSVKLADFILDLADDATGKGLIHTTYGLAARIKTQLAGDPRFLFHTKWDKAKALDSFLAADSNVWLIGAGMSQGIDLKFDKGRHQVISKCLFPNKGQHAIAVRAERDPEWYAWQAIREILQSYGRICRDPEDYGETWITDEAVKMLWNRYPHLWPKWIDLE